MSKDTIYRQDAMNAFDCSIGGVPVESVKYVFEYADKMMSRINALPSAKPERKTGEWIDGKRMKNDGTFYWFRQCDQCGYERNDCDTEKDSNFCPDCGADMRGEQND